MNSVNLYLYNLVCSLLPETRFFVLKTFMLRICNVTVGNNVKICSSVKILGSGKLNLGDNVWIGPECRFYIAKNTLVSIGENVDIAPCVYFGTGTHKISHSIIKAAGEGIGLDIHVKSGVWIGARAVILPGVTIEECVVVGAASLVNKNLPSRTICAGNPCKFIKSI
jgi:acetyltransferase-like isoleucine patch superfamily enzyme